MNEDAIGTASGQQTRDSPKGPRILQTTRSGYELLNDPLLNKGTAFSEAERDEFDLLGLLPPYVSTLDLQVERRLEGFRSLGNNLDKYTFLRGLQDTNETLTRHWLAQPALRRPRSHKGSISSP